MKGQGYQRQRVTNFSGGFWQMTICLWNLFHFNSFQQKKKKKEKIKCPKVNTMICVVGAVTRKKKKKICVFYPFGRGVHVAHGVPNFTQPSIPTQPITKGMFKLQSHTPFWIHDHLYFIPPAPGAGSNNKETKRQREKETKRKREKTHLCQCPGTERTAAKSHKQKVLPSI
jgi:hypothetical protein